MFAMFLFLLTWNKDNTLPVGKKPFCSNMAKSISDYLVCERNKDEKSYWNDDSIVMVSILCVVVISNSYAVKSGAEVRVEANSDVRFGSQL